ncbi:MAG: hypothetical protein PHC68_18925 [Syntrophorhabdaceae bacterium]|nr:hypothetical protein [Syntrophorhabdaceae bacterium]
MDVLKIQEKIRAGEKLTKKEADYYRTRMPQIIKKGNRQGAKLTKKEDMAYEEYENTHFVYEFNVIIEADRATQDLSDDEKKAILGAVKTALNDLGYFDEDLDIG